MEHLRGWSLCGQQWVSSAFQASVCSPRLPLPRARAVRSRAGAVASCGLALSASLAPSLRWRGRLLTEGLSVVPSPESRLPPGLRECHALLCGCDGWELVPPGSQAFHFIKGPESHLASVYSLLEQRGLVSLLVPLPHSLFRPAGARGQLPWGSSAVSWRQVGLRRFGSG